MLMTYAVAHGQGGKYGATPEDSVKCVQNLSVYKDFVKEKKYKEAVGYWRIPCEVCPKSQKSLYTNGVKMYRSFIKAEEDAAKKEALIDTLMTLYDKRIEYFGERGKVLGFKGQDLFRYRRKTAAQEAYDILKEAVQLEGAKSGAGVALSYYRSIYKLFGEKKVEKTLLLEEYPTAAGICEENIKNNNDKKGNYQKALDNINKIFETVAKCEDIVGLYKGRIEAAPDDLELKKSALTIMEKRKCTDSQEFGDWAKAVCEVEPSEECAANIGKYEVGKKNYASAAKYFEVAIQQCGDCDNKLNYHKYAGQAYLAQGATGSARKHARAMLAIDANSGAAYMILGKAAAADSKGCGTSDFDKKACYWIAVDNFIKAKSVDSSVAAEANSAIATYSKYFPDKAMAFQFGFKDGDPYTVECLGVATKVRVQ